MLFTSDNHPNTGNIGLPDGEWRHAREVLTTECRAWCAMNTTKVTTGGRGEECRAHMAARRGWQANGAAAYSASVRMRRNIGGISGVQHVKMNLRH